MTAAYRKPAIYQALMETVDYWYLFDNVIFSWALIGVQLSVVPAAAVMMMQG